MEIELRSYHESDLYHLYQICLKTGAHGQDATGLIDEELLGHFFLAPYCVLEPEFCFVLTVEGEPSGYIVGTADSAQFADRCEREWWPSLRARYPQVQTPASFGDFVIRSIHEGYAAPAFSDRYPAHLHIDNLPVAQGVGQGRVMMDRFMDALREKNVAGVHLGVSKLNERAVAFYRKYGMHEIEQSETVYYMGLRL